MYGHLLPDCLESGLVAGYCCTKCGHVDGMVSLLRPTVKLSNQGNSVTICYPIRCSCGGTGHADAELPILLFGYLLARVRIVEASRSAKAPKQVKPGPSEMLDRFIRDFGKAFAGYAASCGLPPAVLPPQKATTQAKSADRPTEVDRVNFGFTAKAWQDFLQRLGFDADLDRGKAK